MIWYARVLPNLVRQSGVGGRRGFHRYGKDAGMTPDVALLFVSGGTCRSPRSSQRWRKRRCEVISVRPYVRLKYLDAKRFTPRRARHLRHRRVYESILFDPGGRHFQHEHSCWGDTGLRVARALV